ncbi:MAG: hypothetical protein MN733_17525 [Nitrososphaera sp.]|nr:hypothetical protein [Nitrososphaera sp.]
MALLTLGTAAATTLPAIRWNSVMSVADLAALNTFIKYIDGNSADPTYIPNPSISQGVLYIPSRGQVKLFEGDYIGVDPNTGQPIVLSAATAAAASWVHT